jgi:hypothetical protein
MKSYQKIRLVLGIGFVSIFTNQSIAGAQHQTIARPVVASPFQLQLNPEFQSTSTGGSPGSDWEAHDYVLSFLAGQAGAIAGAFAGGYLMSLTVDNCDYERDDCAFNGVVETFLGGIAGMGLGAASAVYWHGQSTGLDGSFGSTILGAYIGMLGSFGAIALAVDSRSDVGTVAASITAILLPGIGATIGYKLFAKPRSGLTMNARRKHASGALIDFQAEDGIHIRPPTIGVTQQEQGYKAEVLLLGGRF